MKKFIKDYQVKSLKELEKETADLRIELAKLKLQEKVNPSKDSNKLHKRKKNLSILLTVITQKKELETLRPKAEIKK